jgi:hypothetical protein
VSKGDKLGKATCKGIIRRAVPRASQRCSVLIRRMRVGFCLIAVRQKHDFTKEIPRRPFDLTT